MKRGPRPKGIVVIQWKAEFAYAIGLLVSDGCLSKDGRHIIMTSADCEQLHTFNYCLGINKRLCKKYSGREDESYYVQFSDVLFYRFLLEIGLSPAKSKTISSLYIPQQFFFDFLRGYFDGDGCSYSYYDPVYVNSYRFYISFASGSERFLNWLRSMLEKHAGIRGHISRKRGSSNIQLRYSKREAEIIAKKMYYHQTLVCLERKKLKVFKSLSVLESCRGGGIGRHAAFRSP